MSTYYFKHQSSPTVINLQQAFSALNWQPSQDNAVFQDQQLMSDQLLQQFEYKHRLLQWANKVGLECHPESNSVDELNLAMVLERMHHLENNLLIIKPSLLNNGKGIRLLKGLKDLESFFQSSDRFSGLHVVQRYIEPPLLYNERKFSLRVFVVLSSKGQVYCYPHGYLNVCNQPYELNSSDLTCHLSNEYLNSDGSSNNQQIPTFDWPEYHLYSAQITESCPQLFQPWLINQTFDSTQYAVLGVDFMLDANSKLWLLEVNHGPCFPTDDDHPLYQVLYQPFWQALVREIVEVELCGAVNEHKCFDV